MLCCISLYSYIKPQLILSVRSHLPVVYPYIPTSNRNAATGLAIGSAVVYPYIPTSNRNQLLISTFSALLYILIFLHQTATCC